MGRVFFNTRLNIHKITADYTCLESDSGKLFLCNPTATTAITLPTPGSGTATAGEGWNCKIILQSDSGFGGDEEMDFKVNVDLGADTNNVGQIHGHDTATSDQAVDGDDFINCTAAASPGDTIEFLSDGTRWYIIGHVFDASECPFGTATA